jgi:3-hydroxyisobutyrate dehydrogenase-like beta-hydroxyacid dehydrogenase
MPCDVGFVGLGQMGLPMARNLANAGYSLSGFDLNPDKCAEAAVHSTVSIAMSPADVARQAPVVFTCLPSAEAIYEVYTGENGFVQAGRPGILTCDHSTMAPEVSRSLAKAMMAADIHFLEAPIFGIPVQAHEADVYFAIAGEESHIGTVSPFLEVMGRGYRYVGEVGVAHTMKILQNGLGMGHAVLTAEIIVICERLGLDTGAFINLVKEARALGLSVFFEKYAEVLVSGEKTNAGLVPVCTKDTSLARGLAHEVGLPAPILEEAAAVFQEAMDRGWAGEEMTVVSRIARSRKGSSNNEHA